MGKPNRLSNIGALLLMLFSYFISNAQAPEDSVYKVDVEDIQQNLNYLASDELEGRDTGSAGIEMAASFIEKKFGEYGLQPYFETFRDSFKVGKTNAYNVVGMLEGEDENLRDEYLIIGAHYDHIGHGRPVDGDSVANGANDNASGTVGVMQLAKLFTDAGGNKRSILFVLFSGEERGLKGSEHLAARLKDEGLDLYVMLNLEMIGVPMKAKDYRAYITGFENSTLATKFNQYSNDEPVLGFLPQAKQMNLFKRSDNYPFYKEFGVPAQTICTFDFSNYPYYHHVDDEAEFLDAEHMALLIDSLLPGIQKMTQTENREIKMTE